MDKLKNVKVLKAVAWYTVSNFISKAVLYLCTPIYIRLMTTSQYGEYNNFLSWQAILSAVVTLDLSASVNTAFLDYKEKKKFNGFISTISLFSILIPLVICILLLPFLVPLTKIFDMKPYQILILMTYLCFANTLGIFQTEQNVCMTCGGVVLTLVLTFFCKDKLSAILIGSVILNELISIILLIKIMLRSRHISGDYLKYALGIALPLIPHVLAGTILGSSDKIMITKICGSQKTAFYSLIYTISMLITMFTSSANKAWVPWFFNRLQEKDYDSVKKVVALILPFGTIVSVGLCLLAPEIVLIIGGEKYREAVSLMPPLVLHSVVNYYNTFYINIEFYTKKTVGISVATVFSSLLNVVLNYIFINRFGFRAAAYTTLFSSLLSLMFHLYKVHRLNMLIIFDNKRNLMVLVVSFVLCFSTLFLYKSYIFRWILIGFLSVICVCYILKSFKNWMKAEDLKQ